jgi:hypothetical protein
MAAGLYSWVICDVLVPYRMLLLSGCIMLDAGDTLHCEGAEIFVSISSPHCCTCVSSGKYIMQHF